MADVSAAENGLNIGKSVGIRVARRGNRLDSGLGGSELKTEQARHREDGPQECLPGSFWEHCDLLLGEEGPALRCVERFRKSLLSLESRGYLLRLRVGRCEKERCLRPGCPAVGSPPDA